MSPTYLDAHLDGRKNWFRDVHAPLFAVRACTGGYENQSGSQIARESRRRRVFLEVVDCECWSQWPIISVTRPTPPMLTRTEIACDAVAFDADEE